MSTEDVPTFGTTNYATALAQAQGMQLMGPAVQSTALYGNQYVKYVNPRRVNFGVPMDSRDATPSLREQFEKSLEMEPKVAETIITRLVKVFIVDPDLSLKVEDRMLYRGPEMLTEATDQELFYALDLGSILAKHNELRIKTKDKKIKILADGTVTYLEPARFRDLKMQVVELARF